MYILFYFALLCHLILFLIYKYQTSNQMIKKEKNCVKHPPVFSLNYDIHDLLFFFLRRDGGQKKKKNIFVKINRY